MTNNSNAINEAFNRLDAIEKEAKAIRELLDENPKSIFDRVKSFDQAFEIYKSKNHVCKEIQVLLDYDGSDSEVIAMQGMAQINILRTVLNEGWEPNWKNSSEYKYYPWFNMASGVGLSSRDYGHADARTFVGSRLCFKTSELAKYAGTQFIDIYKKLFVL